VEERLGRDGPEGRPGPRSRITWGLPRFRLRPAPRRFPTSPGSRNWTADGSRGPQPVAPALDHPVSGRLETSTAPGCLWSFEGLHQQRGGGALADGRHRARERRCGPASGPLAIAPLNRRRSFQGRWTPRHPSNRDPDGSARRRVNSASFAEELTQGHSTRAEGRRERRRGARHGRLAEQTSAGAMRRFKPAVVRSARAKGPPSQSVPRPVMAIGPPPFQSQAGSAPAQEFCFQQHTKQRFGKRAVDAPTQAPLVSSGLHETGPSQ